jgi:protein LSM14
LISKKNIRYEGVLYSINEENSTVALQNVRSFGTEGRGEQVVAASDAVHPYMVFRGQDIQDLHVHEDEAGTAPPPEPASGPAAAPAPASRPSSNVASSGPPVATHQGKATSNDNATATTTTRNAPAAGAVTTDENARGAAGAKPPPPQAQRSNNRRRRNEVGTGASLLNVRPRGAVAREEDDPVASVAANFDFSAQNDAFAKDEIAAEETAAYQKDDFFDSLSCDTTDKLSGADNRLRGHAERKLNTETFGAVALNSRRTGRGRGRGGGRGGRGRGSGGGGREGRGGGRGRGREGRGTSQRPTAAADT